MVDLIAAAFQLQQQIESHGWRFCFIGGLAVQHWGEPRMTRDLDVSLLVGFGTEAPFVDALLQHYPGRISDARAFALERRILLLRTESGIGIDVSLAALPFEERAVNRSIHVEFVPGMNLRICSGEDLIVMKIFAGREIDLRDVRSIITRQGENNFDWKYVESQVSELAELKEDPNMLPLLRKLRADG